MAKSLLRCLVPGDSFAQNAVAKGVIGQKITGRNAEHHNQHQHIGRGERRLQHAFLTLCQQNNAAHHHKNNQPHKWERAAHQAGRAQQQVVAAVFLLQKADGCQPCPHCLVEHPEQAGRQGAELEIIRPPFQVHSVIGQQVRQSAAVQRAQNIHAAEENQKQQADPLLFAGIGTQVDQQIQRRQIGAQRRPPPKGHTGEHPGGIQPKQGVYRFGQRRRDQPVPDVIHQRRILLRVIHRPAVCDQIPVNGVAVTPVRVLVKKARLTAQVAPQQHQGKQQHQLWHRKRNALLFLPHLLNLRRFAHGIPPGKGQHGQARNGKRRAEIPRKKHRQRRGEIG